MRASARESAATAQTIRAILVGIVLCAIAFPSLGQADDSATVHIRAHSRLRLREGERGGSRNRYYLNVAVQLYDNQPREDDDDGVDRSFSGQRVRLDLLSEGAVVARELVATDASGAASHRFTGLSAGGYRVLAHYDGDAERDQSDAFIDVALDRRPTELDLELPTEVFLRDPVPVKLALRTSDRPLSGTVMLTFGDRPAKGVLVGLQGRSESIELKPPPVPGTLLKVEARFPGSDEYAPALVVRELQILTQARVSLEAAARSSRGSRGDGLEVAQGGKLVVSGTAFDDSGPLIGETVDILSDISGEKRHLGSVLTDAYGHYELRVPKLHLRVGSAFLISQVTPRRRHVVPGRSAELPLTVLPPEPVSLLYFIVPLAGTALVLLSLLAARALRPRIALWLARLRDRRSRTAASIPDELRSSLRPSLPATGEAGVQLGQKASLTLRRTIDSTIDGVVHDAVFGPAIAGASLEVLPGGSRVTTTDAEGRFVFSQLPAGRYTIRVRAPGFVDEEFAASVPHRGDLRGITVRLMPLRARLFAEWQRVAELFYGDKDDLVAKTPHELLVEAEQPSGKAKKKGGQPIADLRRLRRLTALVEQGYYSRHLCTQEMLDEAARLAAALLPAATAAHAPGQPPPGAAGPRDIRAPGAPRPLESR